MFFFSLSNCLLVLTLHIWFSFIYTYIYIYRGCQKMYTHFKRCSFLKMCLSFLAPSVCVYIYIYIYIYTYIYIYIYIYRGLELKSKFQHTGTGMPAALPPLCLCCHPAVFFFTFPNCALIPRKDSQHLSRMLLQPVLIP